MLTPTQIPASFQFLSAPHTKHGPPGNLFIFLGHAARAAAKLFQQLGRQGRSRAKRIGGGFRSAPRSGGSFRDGGLRSAAVSVRAVKISARLIERASDTRNHSCASQHLRKGSPGSAS